MTNTDPLLFLKLHRSTQGLAEDQIEAIAAHAEVVRFQEGEVVQKAEERVDALMLVTAGLLRLSLVLPDGREKPLTFFGRDDQIGMLTLIQDEPMPVSLLAVQPSVVLRIPREPALQLMQDLPLWNRNLLQSLAPNLRDTLLEGKATNRPRFVAFIHTCEQSRPLTAQLVQQLTLLGERVGLLSDCDDTLGIQTAYSMSVIGSNGNTLTDHQIREVIGSWSDVERVVLDCHVKQLSANLVELIVGSEATYWLCTSETSPTVVGELQGIVNDSPKLREKNFAIRVLAKNEQVAPLASELADVCHSDFKLHEGGCELDSGVCTRKAGIDRILHHLRGVSIGLALGGGAARGMAHLGVLQVLEESGITIDRMSGTSAGALTGIVYAAGYNADYLVDCFANDLKPGRIYRLLPYGDAVYVLLKYRLGGWDPMLRKYLHDWRLEQLPLPFSSVAVDLVAAEAVIRRRGDATTALLESINLPGISRPLCRDGRALVDGGILDVVPADVVVNQGANFVISSDVSAKISFEYDGNRTDTPTKEMRVPGGISSLFRSRTVQDRNIRSMGGSAADIVIEPDISTVEVTDFKNADKTAELGRTAAEAALPELKRVLHAMDPQLFPGR